VGFCSNDIQEPFSVNLKYGGTGSDYHDVNQNKMQFVNLVTSHTGFGRLLYINLLMGDGKFWDLENLSSDISSNESKKQLTEYLNNLDQIIFLAKEENISIAVLILPHTFQVENKSLRKIQKYLISYFEKNDITYIDFTEKFENKSLDKYFIDDNHYTVEGHKYLASVIYTSLFSSN
jgi:lysophospholipase L1-like esterase